MKKILLFSFLIIANIAMGQGINNLIEEGVKYHDLGRYNEAISMYEKALK
ncbi:MAG: tetratricopeptide repeat-containing protein, partial [Bacteroidales bacterium]|nr:tetratricopeptide repeat-containing protein [Bacteroidales bacterium]